MKLGIYCRISRIKDGNDLSIADQQQKGMAKADELGIPYELYIDEGLSGASESISDRPEFERFIGDVANNTLSHVFAYDQSRFERNPQIRFVINNLFKKHNVTYITQMNGLVDLHDPQSEFFGDLLSVINKFHVTTTKIKVKSALRLRVKEGKTRGILPYGYTKDDNDFMIVDETEAVIVRRIYQMSLEGIGTRTISETLNNEGVPTRYNTMGSGTVSVKNKYTGIVSTRKKKDVKWAPNTITNIIKNTIYKGDRLYSGIITKLPAIFATEYWDKVNYHLPLNRNNTGKKVEYRYLLKGLIRCGVCGRNMYGRKREEKHDNHYMCSSKRIKGENCGNRSINIDRIEYFIWQNLFYECGLRDKIKKEFHFDDKEINRLSNNLVLINKSNDSLNTERQRAIDLVIKGIISENDIANNLKDIDNKINTNNIIINENKQKLFALENSNKIVTKHENDFETFNKVTTFERKRNIINDFISNIDILYLADKGEYKIDIDFKIDLQSSIVISKMERKDTSYTLYSSPEDFEKGEDYFIGWLPDELNNELYNGKDDDKDDDKDDEPNAGGASDNVIPPRNNNNKMNPKKLLIPLLSPLLLMWR
ncbi:recombinase family protein [Flavobacterium sp. LB1P71]|uniref:recombinase family protein n=1 Tax=unclassified Flavobacterium TaxID=196869 RepID=UPI003AAC0A09